MATLHNQHGQESSGVGFGEHPPALISMDGMRCHQAFHQLHYHLHHYHYHYQQQQQ